MIPLPGLVSQERSGDHPSWTAARLWITAAIVAAIAVAATAAMLAGVAVSQTAVTAETVDQLSGRVSESLQARSALDSHMGLGLLNLNQQTALLQEQVDSLWLLQQVSCTLHLLML